MSVSTYRDLERVCIALGLRYKVLKKGVLYEGNANGKYCSVAIHAHAGGRDIPTGTFNQYVKELGFKAAQDYFDYLNKI